MTQPTKREQLAAMRLEDFKAHLRTITGEYPINIFDPAGPFFIPKQPPWLS